MDRPTFRQYIGARYIPAFFENSATGDSTWASGIPYDPLTIVTWNGIQYISKKLVPATVGNPSDNPQYWIVSNTSGIGTLTARVETLENEMDTANSQLNTLDNTVDTLGNTVDTLEDTVDSFDDTIDTLSNNSEIRIGKRRFIFMGDSYDTISATRWTTVVKNTLDLTDSPVVVQGGYGFVTGQDKKFQDLLAATTIDHEETITDIVIVGGANDAWASAGTLVPAMQAFDTYVKGRFTNLRNVWVGFVGNSFLNRTQRNQMYTAMSDYITGAGTCGWNYMTNIECTLYNPNFMQKIGADDYIHPNEAGVYRIARNVIECLLTGSCQNNNSGNYTFDITRSSTVGSGTIEIDECVINNMVYFRFLDTTFTATSAIGNTVITLGTCPELKNAFPPSWYIPIIITDTTSSTLLPGVLYFDADFKTLKLINYITIPQGHSFRIQATQACAFLPSK